MSKAPKIIILSGLLAMLAACANPVVAAPVSTADRDKSCEELAADITQTQQLKTAAREDDEFQWRYIGVVNGFVSAYRMNKAETAATKRLAELENISSSRGCTK